MDEFKQLETILKLKNEIDIDLGFIEKYQSELNLKAIYDNNNDLSKTITKIKNDYSERINELKSINSSNDITINKLMQTSEDKEKNIIGLKDDINNLNSVILNHEKTISSLKSKH